MRFSGAGQSGAPNRGGGAAAVRGASNFRGGGFGVAAAAAVAAPANAANAAGVFPLGVAAAQPSYFVGYHGYGGGRGGNAGNHAIGRRRCEHVCNHDDAERRGGGIGRGIQPIYMSIRGDPRGDHCRRCRLQREQEPAEIMIPLVDTFEDNRSAFQRQNAMLKANEAPTLKLRETFESVISSAADAGIDCFSDVKLICEEKTFNCHRLILAGRSDTFQGMFANPSFAEGKTGKVEIEDITAEVMEDVLRFIYCGYLNSDLDTASPELEHQFLYAAHKYQISALVDLVMFAIKDKLNATTACRYLLYADLYSLQSLKLSCYEVLSADENRPVVAATAEWKDIAARADLMTELYLFVRRPATSPFRSTSPVSNAATVGSSGQRRGPGLVASASADTVLLPPGFGGNFVPASHDDDEWGGDDIWD